MSTFTGTPSDDLPEVCATGQSDVSTVFVSLSARHPEGRDADYIRWHSLDHRPEQYRLAGLRDSLRLVSTPECRSSRAASDDRYQATDHVMTYFFADYSALRPFRKLGKALGAAGRMPIQLPSVEMDVYSVAGKTAARRVVAGADVIPWRPAVGVYLLLEEGTAAPGGLADVDGVAGVWWFAARASEGTVVKQLTYCYLDDNPIAVAERLRPVIERRWAHGRTTPLLAAPFFTVVAYEWDKYLP